MKITRRQLRQIIKESLPTGIRQTQQDMSLSEKEALVDRLGRFFERHVKQQEDLKDLRFNRIEYKPEFKTGFMGDKIWMEWDQYQPDERFEPDAEPPPPFYTVRPHILFKGTPGLSDMRHQARPGQSGWRADKTYVTFGIGETQSNWFKLGAWLDENESKTFTRKELGI